ncbi:S-adenosyl-L-methionine dependent methyltransferase [Fragilariopsis cylindrus CCMP1102]|uniref:S-adenosyl-L-methionine dependent methyltransferase n=1 Tax=Fragilariopsis cylindrus CCMP1102 TaxID=635003 RepID=A0A1E7EJR9_9STRA|nr:S-adenosyl-L-methionine dependent methyltransferase [Fragilariopsis cylindrus CCMP1102]|eukprot:OEU06112.1 S-adenosyl-L-methionine dependent methyltransferase [Fragilariopsis cylindrus CCMP1102]
MACCGHRHILLSVFHHGRRSSVSSQISHARTSYYSSTTRDFSGIVSRRSDNVTHCSNNRPKLKRTIDKRSKNTRQGPHSRNSFQGSYNMEALCKAYPPLSDYIIHPPTGDDQSDTETNNAVRALNTALLVLDYDIAPSYAEILPEDALVPPVPGRAEYVHYIADVLAASSSSSSSSFPIGSSVKGCDIGTGASLIYPLIANSVYGWSMIGSEVNPSSTQSARTIAKANNLQEYIDVRHQQSTHSIFHGIWETNNEIFDFTMCNPPFYPSLEACQAESARKLRGLARGASNNFEGTASELWCDGGEVGFVKRMINESKQYRDNCLWFTSLVARKDSLEKIERHLKKGGYGARPAQIHKIRMGAGTKSASIIMWTFMDQTKRRQWASKRGWGVL